MDLSWQGVRSGVNCVGLPWLSLYVFDIAVIIRAVVA